MNRDKVVSLLRTESAPKTKKLLGYYIMLGYDEIEAMKKARIYCKYKKKYFMLRNINKLLIKAGYYRRATTHEIIDIVKHRINDFTKHKFVYYVPVSTLDKWLAL